MDKKKILLIIAAVIILIPVVVVAINVIGINSKQTIENGSVWTYADYIPPSSSPSDMGTVSGCVSEHYIDVKTGTYATEPRYDYFLCEDGVIKLHHYVGINNGDYLAHGKYACSEYKVEVKEIGTYKGNKIKFNSGIYKEAYAKDDRMYVTVERSGKEFVLIFELTDNA